MSSIQKKNWKYSDETWQPIVYLNRHFSPEEIKPYYELGDLCIVSSLHDGMNLVAKEYVAAKRGIGRNAHPEPVHRGVARAHRRRAHQSVLDRGIRGRDQVRDRNAAGRETQAHGETCRRSIAENNVYRWAANIITELTALKKSGGCSAE